MWLIVDPVSFLTKLLLIRLLWFDYQARWEPGFRATWTVKNHPNLGLFGSIPDTTFSLRKRSIKDFKHKHIYLFTLKDDRGKEGEARKEWERDFHSLIHFPNNNNSHGWAEGRNPALHSDRPMGGPSSVASQAHWQEAGSEVELGLCPRHSSVRCRFPSALMCCATVPTLILFKTW